MPVRKVCHYLTNRTSPNVNNYARNELMLSPSYDLSNILDCAGALEVECNHFNTDLEDSAEALTPRTMLNSFISVQRAYLALQALMVRVQADTDIGFDPDRSLSYLYLNTEGYQADFKIPVTDAV